MTFRLWRFRIAHAGRFGYHRAVWVVWDAWARAEGGEARFNPWNTEWAWPGSTNYNPQGVRNYPSAKAGIAATIATLHDGHYPRMLHFFAHPSKLTPRQIVEACRADFDTWGTGADRVIACLPPPSPPPPATRGGHGIAAA